MARRHGFTGRRDPPDPTSFGEVKIFNERSTDAQVNVALCQGRGDAAAASNRISVAAGTPPDNPATWTPQDLENILSARVDAYASDGTTMTATFGPMGVGRAGGPTQVYLSNLQITLGDWSVTVEIFDEDWSQPPIRTATIALNNPPMSTWFNVTCVGNGNQLVSVDPSKLKVGREPDPNGDGVVQNPVIPNDLGQQWELVPPAQLPPGTTAVGQLWLQSNTQVTAAVARYVADGNPQLAGMAVPPGSPFGSGTDGLLVIQYSDGPGDTFQIVDLATGLALTSPSADTSPQPQLTFIAPDPSPPGTNAQLWTFVPISGS